MGQDQSSVIKPKAKEQPKTSEKKVQFSNSPPPNQSQNQFASPRSQSQSQIKLQSPKYYLKSSPQSKRYSEQHQSLNMKSNSPVKLIEANSPNRKLQQKRKNFSPQSALKIESNYLDKEDGQSTRSKGRDPMQNKSQSMVNEMKECTFQPKVNNKQIQVRSIDMFYQDQQKFKDEKDKKIQLFRKLKEEFEFASLQPPQINDASRQMRADKILVGDTYSRQVSQRKEQDDKLEQKRYKPITTQSTMNLQERILAKQRLSDTTPKGKKFFQLTVPKSDYLIKNSDYNQQHHKGKTDLIENSLKRELDFFTNNQDEINFDQFQEIMTQMGFVQKNINNDLQEIWEIFADDLSQSITKNQALQFILAIHGLRSTNEQQFTQENVMEFQQRYYKLYLNRLHSAPSKPKKEDLLQLKESKVISMFDIQTTNIKFQQEIQRAAPKHHSQADQLKTSELAGKFRGKLIDQFRNQKSVQQTIQKDDKEISLETLLCFSKETHKQKTDEKRLQTDLKELLKCTFTPQILRFNSEKKSLDRPNQNVGKKNRTEVLSKIRHPHPIPRDKSTIEYENSRLECTFKPNITTFLPLNESENKLQSIKNVDQSIQRVRNAWDVKSNINNFLKRGEQNHKSPNRKNLELDQTQQQSRKLNTYNSQKSMDSSAKKTTQYTEKNE